MTSSPQAPSTTPSAPRSSGGLARWAGPLAGLASPLGLACLVAGPLAPHAAAQDPTRPDRGLRQVDPRWHALVHADVVPSPGRRVADATVVLRDGIIVSVRPAVEPPAGARVWDASGLTVYAGLVEPHLPVEAPAPPAGDPGLHWSPSVLAQRSALDGSGPSQELREELRALGFTAAAVAPESGVFRGQAAVVSLGEPGTETAGATAEVLAPAVYQAVSFERARVDWGGDVVNPRYPTSQMGAIALIRQTLADADWYARTWEVYRRDPTAHEPPAVNDALEALSGAGDARLPLLFDAGNELELLRAARVAEEFGRRLIGLGSGTEFRRLDALVSAALPLVVPLSFPEEPEVDTLAAAESLSLRQLMTWEQAPTNLRRLDGAGLSLALTTDKLDERDEFYENLRSAIRHGLDESRALAMLTVAPARLLGLEERLGRVEPGMLANLVVVDGDLFDEEAEIRDVWIGGRRYEVNPAPDAAPEGRWTTSIAGLAQGAFEGTVVIEEGGLSLESGETVVRARDVEARGERVRFLLDAEELGGEGTWSFSAAVEAGALHGSFFGPDGRVRPWSATRAAEREADAGEEAGDEGEAGGEETAPDVPERYGTPFGAYGLERYPEARDVLVRGATVWTAGPAGIVEDGALLVRDGRIAYVGPAAGAPEAPGALVVDGAGKHVTPGLIDCHSHTGASGGLNEVGQRVTAEVRVQDVIDPDDVAFYRQLAGGLTAANQLHGSANAIGGQNCVVKLRWGVSHPDEMRLAAAKPGIKFALGENPKRVAANTGVSDEYPQTRMGVEMLIRDRLSAGRDYNAAHARFEALPPAERRRRIPPRRDLELEAMGEIVAGRRLVHCHSYRQDEILMLCRVARDFGFTIGTFQHVLEGYKVAEAIREAALGASTFADWWAYKFEVIDAIPFNATLMADVGVTVSINSDSDDHARRLNTEAAKAVKYGGLDPHEALKLVTINPAIQLAVEDRVGSLEVGKDGDFALWSGDPLSYLSRCEETWVDGRRLFSLERDRELAAAAERERHRIIQKIYAASRKAEDESEKDEEDDEPAGRRRTSRELDTGRLGSARLPGDCGCGHWSEQ